jgi:hypothetical protein
VAKQTYSAPGEWDNEPDELDWTDERTGYQCRIVRNRMGNLCGYVRLPDGHPLHGVSYSDNIPERMKPLLDVVMEGPIGKRGPIQVFCAAGGVTHVDILFDVHGGLTFSGVPLGAADGFWYGFDCGHCDDLSPGMMRLLPREDEAYRNVAYVQAECASLAKQLKQVAA